MIEINRKYRFIVRAILFSFLFLVACTKDELPVVPHENAPIFQVKGTLDGEQISLIAGENEVFMNTYVDNWNNVHLFSGELKNEKSNFTIQLADGLLDVDNITNGIVEDDEFAIMPRTMGDPLYSINKQDFANAQNIFNVEWIVDGEVQPNETLKIYEPGDYQICATITFNDDSNQQTCNEVLVGYKRNTNARLTQVLGENEKITAFFESENQEVNTVKWFLNDSLVSHDDVYLNSNPDNEQFHLKSTALFTNGTSITREVFVNKYNFDNRIDDFVENGNYATKVWDNKVRFKIEHNGETYTSIQNTNNSTVFTINEIGNHEINSSGEMVRKLVGNLNCLFINNATNQVIQGNFKIIIALGY